MMVGSCRILLRLAGVRTLKDKRRLIKPLICRLRNRYNAAVAEIGHQDVPDRAEIGVAVVSDSRRHAESQLGAVVEAVYRAEALGMECLSVETEIF